MYVYTPVRNNAGRATTPALARYPSSGQPTTPVAPSRSCALPRRAATILTMPCQPLPLPICSATDHPHRPRLPYRHPRHPPQLTAVSTTRTTTTHSFSPVFLSRRTCLSLFPFLFPLPSSSNARSNPARRVRPYPWRASTGTPARSLKENAIIRRTSTNELIVGASRYRQCREVLYSTSPVATRL